MFSTALHPRPQPTVLLSTAMVPVCGSAVERSLREREVVGSIPTTPTKADAVMGSEAISFATVAVIAAGTNDRRANKREQANADN